MLVSIRLAAVDRGVVTAVCVCTATTTTTTAAASAVSANCVERTVHTSAALGVIG
jgi:hypothetical protein